VKALLFITGTPSCLTTPSRRFGTAAPPASFRNCRETPFPFKKGARGSREQDILYSGLHVLYGEIEQRALGIMKFILFSVLLHPFENTRFETWSVGHGRPYAP